MSCQTMEFVSVWLMNKNQEIGRDCVIKGAAVSFELGVVQPSEGLSVKLE